MQPNVVVQEEVTGLIYDAIGFKIVSKEESNHFHAEELEITIQFDKGEQSIMKVIALHAELCFVGYEVSELVFWPAETDF